LKDLNKASKIFCLFNKFSKQAINAQYKNVKVNNLEEAYQHPYHSDKFPIYWSTKNLILAAKEAIGPEPVSPHYESFVMSRKVPICKLSIFILL
jgi:hypothetical protein